MSKPAQNIASFIDRENGRREQVEISLEDYKEAADLGITLPQLYTRKYEADEKYGSAFSQMMASCGLIMQEDRNFGLRSPSLKDVFDGKANINMGVVIERPDGADRNTPAGRLLFPAVLLDLLESSLRDNRESYNSVFMQMVAFTRTINSNRYDQVVVDYSTPRSARSAPIAQMAEPVRMLSITTSSISKAIPVWSIGIEISKEAQAASTLDLIAIAIREHSLEEHSARLEEDFAAIVNGSLDNGEAGIIGSAVTATSFDSTIANTAGLLSQRAWVLWLRKNWRKRNINWVVCDMKTYLNIEARTGRPTVQNLSGTDERLNTVPRIMLPGIPQAVNVFVTEDPTFGTNTIVGLDSSKAMRRIVYAAAEYQAIEEYVMRKSTAMRMDASERIESAGYPEAFSVLTLV